jgi:4-hydroxyphenylacetate 3-monooxygenase
MQQPQALVADSLPGGAGPALRSAIRSGADYLRALDDGRQVFVAGKPVKDVTRHPAFQEAARYIANMYDMASAPETREALTVVSPEAGSRILRAYQIPRTIDDLRAKRIAAEVWAETAMGLMGRSPDHVAGFFCGFAACPGIFAAGGEHFARNVVSFYEHLRDNDLYVSYAIVPPQIDRSKPAHQQADPTLYAGVVKEADGGIYVSGGQQLATGGVYSDYLYLSCIHPLQPGDENQAIGVAMPMNAPGLKLYPRRPFALQAGNAFDYPLSSRFDETDCFVVLENVFVPWEHVFIYRNRDVCFNQWWKTPSHLYGNLQAQARYVTKLRFMIGLAKRINEMTGNDGVPAVQVQMGELAALVSLVENSLEVQEVKATSVNGVIWPSKTALYSVMALQSELNARMIEIIRELSGAAMISVPGSLEDIESAVTGPDMERYMRSGKAGVRERVALMRLAWDFIGSEFGSRHQQYEKFYGGASFLVKQNVYRNFDFARATAMVDRALNLPDIGAKF